MLYLHNVVLSKLTSSNLIDISRMLFLLGIMFLLSFYVYEWFLYQKLSSHYRSLRNGHPVYTNMTPLTCHNGRKLSGIKSVEFIVLFISSIPNARWWIRRWTKILNKNRTTQIQRIADVLTSPFLKHYVICVVQYGSCHAAIKWLQIVWRLFGTRMSTFLCMVQFGRRLAMFIVELPRNYSGSHRQIE